MPQGIYQFPTVSPGKVHCDMTSGDKYLTFKEIFQQIARTSVIASYQVQLFWNYSYRRFSGKGGGGLRDHVTMHGYDTLSCNVWGADIGPGGVKNFWFDRSFYMYNPLGEVHTIHEMFILVGGVVIALERSRHVDKLSGFSIDIYLTHGLNLWNWYLKYIFGSFSHHCH